MAQFKHYRAAAILTAVLVGGFATAGQTAPKPRKQTAAEFKRQTSERSLINVWRDDCLRDELSGKQRDYIDSLTEYAAERYLEPLLEEADHSECAMSALHGCEREFPGDCIAGKSERQGRRP